MGYRLVKHKDSMLVYLQYGKIQIMIFVSCFSSVCCSFGSTSEPLCLLIGRVKRRKLLSETSRRSELCNVGSQTQFRLVWDYAIITNTLTVICILKQHNKVTSVLSECILCWDKLLQHGEWKMIKQIWNEIKVNKQI